jgi:hypothetical protein
MIMRKKKLTLQKATSECLGMRTRSGVIRFRYQNSTGCAREETSIFKVAANMYKRPNFI